MPGGEGPPAERGGGSVAESGPAAAGGALCGPQCGPRPCLSRKWLAGAMAPMMPIARTSSSRASRAYGRVSDMSWRCL